MSARNIVLIHGAWAGGWVWDRVCGPLKSAGFNPVVVELPGSGSWNPDDVIDLDVVAEHVVAVVESLDGQCALVGHSGGGIVASQVAELLPSRVTGLVYVAGMMLPSQTDFGMLCVELGLESPVGISRWLVPTADGDATVGTARRPVPLCSSTKRRWLMRSSPRACSFHNWSQPA